MAQEIIDVGTAPNDGLGDPIRTAFIKCNDNFTQLYVRAQPSPPPTLVGIDGDVAGMYAYDSNYFYYCFADYDGSSTIWAQVTQIGNVSVSSIVSGTSEVSVTDVNGNVAVSINGVSNVAVFTVNGIQATGIISTTGNVTGNYFLGNGSQLTGLPETYANANVAAYLLTNTGNIAAGNVLVTGAVSATGNVRGGNILSSGMISTSGDIINQGFISATGNIETAGYFVGTFVGNVTGNFVVPGANTQIVFNTNGNADATAGLTFDTNGPNLLTVLGTISSQGNVVAGNLTTAGSVTTTGNITGGNIITGGLISATGNVRGGNFNTGGLITATGNITGGNVTTTGNITGGNIITGGLISATGNIAGGNLRAITDLDIGGNATATGFTGNFISVIGNITGGNIRTAGIITATGNITGNYFIGNGSQLSGIDTTQIQNGNSNVKIAASNGNVTINVTGVTPLAIFANTGAYIDGVTSVSGNVTAGNISATAHTGTTLSVTANITGGNVLTGGFVSATGNITGGNLLTGGLISATSTITSAANVVGGNITTGGLISATGNITSGNLSVSTGTITVGNIVNGNGNGVGNIGTSSTYFNTVFAQATSAQYADLAENYVADADYAPGTVVVFGGEEEITISREAADERVAGVVSTHPAYLMNSGQPGVPVALRGRVPVMVTGPVFKGDSLVTSSTSGHAQSVGRDRSYAQAVFAKAIETNVSPGEKIITAVIL
jgi:hypothetical protein